jgi:hypothetical protein
MTIRRLLVAALCCLITLSTFGATKGKCGDNIKWELDKKTGVLTLTGTGATYNYGYKKYNPWYGKSDVRRVVISEGITDIGSDVFTLCHGMISISIPKSVTHISPQMTSHCLAFTTFIVDQGNPNYCSVDGILLSKDNTTLVKFPSGRRGVYTMPSYIQIIGEYAFHSTNLSEVYMHNSITTIKKQAFSWSDIKKVVLPESLNVIESEAFYNCDKLTEITIPHSVSIIGKDAFGWCDNLKKINVPYGLDISSAGAPSSSYKRYNQNKQSSSPSSPQSTPQSTPATSPKSLPLLTMVEDSWELVDPTNNNCIDANENCRIRFSILNNGKGPATNCEARVTMRGTTNGISAKNVKIPTINVGQMRTIEIPVTSSMQTAEGRVTLSIEVYEPNGMGISPFDIAVNTKAFSKPNVQIVDYQLASESGKFQKKSVISLAYIVQNIGEGDAENIKVNVHFPTNVALWDGEESITIPSLVSGESKMVKLDFIANGNYTAENIPIVIDVREKYGTFAQNKTVEVALNKAASSTITIEAKDEPKRERQEIQLATIGSAVDKNIPVSKQQNKQTFVVIIANENYRKVAGVPYAINDGNIFRQYCEKTLGIPSQNIHYQPDATLNEIQDEVKWLRDLTAAYKGNARIIFYYAGHGIPDETSKSAYLLPVDGNGSNAATGYKLDDLYAALAANPTKSVTVFLDACFSGSKREGGMIASARGVALKAKAGIPQGNMVVFSAATGDETAYPNNKEGHGMFTYFLLKKLQETEGNVTYSELSKYLLENVSQQSIVLNSKSQTPTVIPSSAVGAEWQNWRLK